MANDGPNGELMSELFVHYKDILGEGRKNLEAGRRVEFEIKLTPRGPRAVAVRLAAGAETK